MSNRRPRISPIHPRVNQGDQEERSPEDQVGRSYDGEPDHGVGDACW